MVNQVCTEFSPRTKWVFSIGVAQQCTVVCKPANPLDTAEPPNVCTAPLSAFDNAMIDATDRFLPGKRHTEAKDGHGLAQRRTHVTAAETYLFCWPAWNLGEPYKLNPYAEVITSPGLRFSSSPETGTSRPVTGEPAAMVYARGGKCPSSEVAKPGSRPRNERRQWPAGPDAAPACMNSTCDMHLL